VPKNAALAGAIHDLQARLGSIRIAVTAVAGLDLDKETRDDMLTSASDESLRASAELAAISALATCLLDDTPPQECDVRAALDQAADATRLAGLVVDVHATDAPPARVSPDRLGVVLPALLRLAGGAGKRVDASLTATTLTINGDDTEALPAVAGYLVDQLGASIAITFGKIP
jgi:hypothetical protein